MTNEQSRLASWVVGGTNGSVPRRHRYPVVVGATVEGGVEEYGAASTTAAGRAMLSLSEDSSRRSAVYCVCNLAGPGRPVSTASGSCTYPAVYILEAFTDKMLFIPFLNQNPES